MTIEKTKLNDSEICEKCSNRMISKKIPIRKNGSLEWQRIKQCISCKHWYPLD